MMLLVFARGKCERGSGGRIGNRSVAGGDMSYLKIGRRTGNRPYGRLLTFGENCRRFLTCAIRICPRWIFWSGIASSGH